MGIIVKSASKDLQLSKARRNWLIGGGLVILLSLWIFDRYVLLKPEDETLIKCNAEDIKQVNQKAVFYQDGYVFQNGDTQSDKEARSGKYSSRIDSAHSYGMYYLLKDPKPGEQYYASIWRKQYGFKAGLILQMTGDSELYREEKEVVEKDASGWERIEMIFSIPDTFKNGRITIYVLGWGIGEAFFDDLEIRKIDAGDRLHFFSNLQDSLPHLQLYLDPSARRQLDGKIENALEKGILITDDDSWVNAKILEQAEKIPVKLRLKGDWTDHLRSFKKSFRIQTKFPFTWQRMPVFSIQHPQARHFLSEWVYHNWLMYEDVLTSKYDFAHVEINGEAKGLYAYEGHFTKELLESQRRREGPILKFDESGVWQARLKADGINYGLEGQLNAFPAAPVQAFQEDQMLQDSLKLKLYQIGRELMQQFKFGKKAAREVFDLEKMAKFYAIVDISQANHSLVWHNMRFYYNPVTSLLEPIGFDGYTELGIMRYSSRPLIGAMVSDESDPLVLSLHVNLFKDPELTSKYIKYLEQFSREEYLYRFLAYIRPGLQHRLKTINREFPHYSYDVQNLKERGQIVRQLLFPLEHAGVQVYRQTGESGTTNFLVNNHHILPLEVLGWGTTKAGGLTDSLAEPTLMEPYDRGRIAKQYIISGPPTAKYLFFRLPGLDTLFKEAIIPIPPQLDESPMQKLLKQTQVVAGKGYEIEGNKLVFSESFRSKENILIPAGYEVHFNAGFELDLVEKAAFVSFSPVYMRGTSEMPVVIQSSDKTAKGFTILQAAEKSLLEYAQFDGLDTWSYKGWQLTGAVTFYESDVHIRHSVFGYSQCEDALNLIRSRFDLESSLIHHAAFDGLDVDFCTGNLNQMTCENTGNDGMDFSGSHIRIINSLIENAGDKGISVGEEAYVRIYHADIKGAKIGVASKDLSEVEIDAINLQNCQTAFAAYQKKPEYGGGKMRVRVHFYENIDFLHQVGPGSVIYFPEKTIQGE